MPGVKPGQIRTPCREFWRRFRRQPVAMGAGVIQGRSLMSYAMDRFRVGKVMRVCLYAFVLLGGVLVQILAFTGLFDMLFDYRRRFGKKTS